MRIIDKKYYDDVTFKDMAYKTRELKRRKCEHCGHSIDFVSGTLYLICSYCGRRVYRDDKTKFKIELKERLKKKEEI